MSNPKPDIAVVVFANRKDFFFSKICIASIRYYYPEVEIYLVKDFLNGNFYTGHLRKAFNVKLIDLGKRYFGWGAAKIFFSMDENLTQRRYLCLDSDIIFIGNLLDRLIEQSGDFIVHPEIYPEPFSEVVKQVFLDAEKIIVHYPQYVYPGYFFNSGQTVVTPGILKKEIFLPAFNPEKYPYYRDHKTFPLVDQSILNIVIPIKMQANEITVSTLPFMLWSIDFFKELDNLTMEKFKDGSAVPYLVHYAGDIRTHRIKKMKGYQLLEFYRRFYYARLSKLAILTSKIQDILAEQKQLARILYLKNRIFIEIINRLKNRSNI